MGRSRRQQQRQEKYAVQKEKPLTRVCEMCGGAKEKYIQGRLQDCPGCGGSGRMVRGVRAVSGGATIGEMCPELADMKAKLPGA